VRNDGESQRGNPSDLNSAPSDDLSPDDCDRPLEDCAQAPVQTNALRGLWRAITRTAKRPILVAFLFQLRSSTLEDLCDQRRLGRLRWAWSNPNSCSVEYLAAVTSASVSARGVILECGSGLTTVVVGTVAHRTGQPYVTLEHSHWWARHVRWAVKVARAEVDYRVAPLREYEGFDWYDIGPALDGIALVVCDGPPATSRGGRYGLFPLCGDHLLADAEIYLDDFDRPSEKLVTERWAEEFHWSVQSVIASHKGLFCRIQKQPPSSIDGFS
jgi:hypothetical protein